MDDPRNIPLGGLHKGPQEKAPGPGAGQGPEPVLEPSAGFVAGVAPEWTAPYPAVPAGEEASRRRGMRQNLFLLLSLTLAAFVLTAWIFVRVDSPFGILSTGPQEIVRAQLRALDRGELRPAYDMFSARYRQQVSFDVWHELIVTHWRMFHAEVLRAGEPAQTGPRVTLEIHLRGADEKGYRARFTLIHLDGRWWIDDVHWAEEPDEHGAFRT
ncbi:MAG: hypothetical protein LAN18_01645 [Acidobacteriia bacterium]|nr:hypothetical protein [Terriglobia bacterium]